MSLGPKLIKALFWIQIRRSEKPNAISDVNANCTECIDWGEDYQRGCLPEWEPQSTYRLRVLYRGKTRVELTRCPKALVIEGSTERQLVGDVLGFIKHGVLPYAGGLLDQPAIFVAALQLIRELIEESKHGEESPTNPMDSRFRRQ